MVFFIDEKKYEYDNEEMSMRLLSTEGTEGNVYHIGDRAVKIYRPFCLKNRLDENTVDYLKTIETKRILLPREKVTDKNGMFCGYTTEYGTMQVAVIDNLSSLITARNSEEGYIGAFGDRLITSPVSKRNGILSQMTEKGFDTRRKIESKVGPCTENGIWIFFKNAIEKKEHWDNIFIYSDQQAGHGGLYGTDPSIREYRKEFGCVQNNLLTSSGYRDNINVLKLVEKYRREVNPKVNVFSVETAGYGNSVVPEYAYRCNILTGWTGKELVFADEIIKQWDAHDASKTSKKQSKKSNKQ